MTSLLHVFQNILKRTDYVVNIIDRAGLTTSSYGGVYVLPHLLFVEIGFLDSYWNPCWNTTVWKYVGQVTASCNVATCRWQTACSLATAVDGRVKDCVAVNMRHIRYQRRFNRIPSTCAIEERLHNSKTFIHQWRVSWTPPWPVMYLSLYISTCHFVNNKWHE